MTLTRRQFTCAVTVPFLATTRYYALRTEQSSARLILDAIAGPTLPLRMAVVECAANDPDAMAEICAYRESRFLEYRECRPRMEILKRAGIVPWLCGERSCMIPFDSLEAREKAWRTLASMSEPDPSVTKIEIYCGRIFEMSL